jgi:hypothetical protein
MAVTHFVAGHIDLNAARTAEDTSSSRPVTAFGVIAGGVFGLIGGLAQYNAMYTGAPRFILPTMFVLIGGVAGSVILGVAGWVLDKLVERIRNA